jgi:NTP pyrophosphatase (non-canonical NTP hydrolase)
MNSTLVIMQEECAEVIQAISKIHRFGLYDVYEGQSNLDRLIRELGDLRCMINMFLDENQIDLDVVEEYERLKKDKLLVYGS